MKKFLAMLLAVVMVLSMVACSKQPAKDPNKGNDDPNQTETITNPDQINDEMTSEDGKYEIAFITDVGQLKDKSFNQGTYDGVKLYAANNKLSYKYYQPANKDQATDDDRYEAMKAAVENGAKVVVCAGFMQEGALRMAAKEFSDVSFVFVDGYPITEEAGVDGSPVLKNVAGIAFKEEQCGYLAGYAVVKEGFTKLGFTGGGGGTNPACCRYGYGFVQGADAAAKELGVKVDMNYSWQYGASFSASPELQTMVSGWYEAGTEVVFACGGSMFASVAAAAGAASELCPPAAGADAGGRGYERGRRAPCLGLPRAGTAGGPGPVAVAGRAGRAGGQHGGAADPADGARAVHLVPPRPPGRRRPPVGGVGRPKAGQKRRRALCAAQRPAGAVT